MSNKWIWHSDGRHVESEEMWAVPGVLRYLTFNLRLKMTKFTAVFCVLSLLFYSLHSAQRSRHQPYQWTCSQRLLVGGEERAHGRTRGGCNVETVGFFHGYIGVYLKTFHLSLMRVKLFRKLGITPLLFLYKQQYNFFLTFFYYCIVFLMLEADIFPSLHPCMYSSNGRWEEIITFCPNRSS